MAINSYQTSIPAASNTPAREGPETPETNRSTSIFSRMRERGSNFFQIFGSSSAPPTLVATQLSPPSAIDPGIAREASIKQRQRKELYMICESAAINHCFERVLWLESLKARGGPIDVIQPLIDRENRRYGARADEFNKENPNYLAKHFRKHDFGNQLDARKVLFSYQLLLMEHLSNRDELFKRLKFDETIVSGVTGFYRNELMEDITWVDSLLKKLAGPAPEVTPLPSRIEVSSRARFFIEMNNAVLQDYQKRLEWLNSAWINQDSPMNNVVIEQFIDDENAFYKTETKQFKDLHNELFREIQLTKNPSSVCQTIEHFVHTYKTMIQQQFQRRNELIDRIAQENPSMREHVPELLMEQQKLFEGQLFRLDKVARQRSEYENESIFKNATLQAHRNRLQWLQSVEIGESLLKKPELLQQCVREENSRHKGLQQSFETYLRGFDRKIDETFPKTYYQTPEGFLQSYLTWIQTQERQRHEMLQAASDRAPDFAERASELMQENRFESEQLQSWVKKADPSRQSVVVQNIAPEPLKPEPKAKTHFSLPRLGVMGALGFAAYHFGSKIPHQLPHITTQAPVFLSYWSDRIVNTIDRTGIAQLAENLILKFPLEEIASKIRNTIQSDPNTLAYAVGAVALIATLGQYFVKK